MRKTSLLGATALRTFAAAGLAVSFTGTAYAQNTQTPVETPTPDTEQVAGEDAPSTLQSEVEVQSGENANTDSEIVVTGSRIRRPNLDSVVPVTSIGGEQFFQQSQSNIGDTLNDLPQLSSTFSQSNPGLGIGIAGLNLLDLRGLGTARTLVLVNGRRHVAADILNNAVSPDVNTIPNDLIERVDIVTGGNSAVYGSDAIAGVVNFVLRRDFSGLQLRANGGVSDKGFGANGYVSAMYGQNFGGDRGNITLHGEFAHQSRIFGNQIPSFRRVDSLGVVDVDTAGLANGSDGFPDRIFIRDIRSASINRFGLVPITQAGTTVVPANITAGALPPGTVLTASPFACGNGIGSTNGAPGLGSGASQGTPYNCTFLFTPGGQLTPQTGSRYGQGIIGGITGGNGQTGREDRLLSVIPFSKRYNINLLSHYEFSEAAEVFVEAKWNRVSALGSNAGPSFIQGTFGQFDVRERVRLDNPFLSPADRTTIANAILASGCNTSLTAACAVPGIASTFNRTTFGGQGVGGPLNDADRAAIAAGTYRFVTSRSLADSGIRDEKFKRDTYRIVGGVRGGFNDDWNYELAVNYGKFKEDTTTFGYLNRQRFLLSLDAGRNPATGQIQCRSQFDPAAATAFAGQAANLAADIAACVPYNPFGGADNSAAADYFTYNARNKASLSQLDILGFVGGDSSQLFELPGGPIRFVVGGEYRRERARYQNDDFVESGATNAVVIGEFDPPTFAVKEAFGEIEAPLLKDLPFAQDLTVSAAGRVSDYKGNVGRVTTFNVGGQYAPVRDVRFRVNYGKAVRAPNVSETGFPAVPNFAPGFLDPCASGQIANNPNRQANCLADLGPTLLAGLPNTAYSLPIISGSNANLDPETSKSLTLGAVVQPRMIPGLSLSVDYYKIKVEDVIVSLAAQTIANSCYDQPTLNNPFCASFTRFQGPGTGPLGEAPGQILGNSLTSAGVNFAKRERRGIDVNFAYRTQIASNVRLDTNLIYTHVLKNSNYENPALPDFENRVLGELGSPKNEFRLDTDLAVGRVTFGYRLQYIGPMVVNLYEDFNELPGACTAAGCPPNNLDYADIRKFPKVFYHDVRVQYDLKGQTGPLSDLQFYAGIDNLLDTAPPLGVTGTGAFADRGGGQAAIYDVRGRQLYAGIRARF
jgi:outer membrane receptor protein involved in Fe transport